MRPALVFVAAVVASPFSSLTAEISNRTGCVHVLLDVFVNRLAHRCFERSSLLLEIPSRLLQAVVALFVCSSGTETDANEGGPRPALE